MRPAPHRPSRGAALVHHQASRRMPCTPLHLDTSASAAEHKRAFLYRFAGQALASRPRRCPSAPRVGGHVWGPLFASWWRLAVGTSCCVEPRARAGRPFIPGDLARWRVFGLVAVVCPAGWKKGVRDGRDGRDGRDANLSLYSDRGLLGNFTFTPSPGRLSWSTPSSGRRSRCARSDACRVQPAARM